MLPHVLFKLTGRVLPMLLFSHQNNCLAVLIRIYLYSYLIVPGFSVGCEV